MQRDEQAYHYGVIRRAIEIIDEDGADLPLEALAARMEMSPAHFQRVFSAWAGVSPKRYQQYLRLGHAKSLLRAQTPLLDTAHAVGLSGSGRLHDLFVRWEAMSPGDYARKGAGLTIRWGWFDSPFGLALVLGTQKGLCGLAFAAEIGAERTLADMRGRWPKAAFIEDPSGLAPQVADVFARRGETQLHLIGAPLQIKVWEALLNIPEGGAATYGEIAAAVKAPAAVRAVGTAVGKNPLSWLIPCHRVLRKGGAMGGYHWGLPVKRAMLAFEGARRDAASGTAAEETAA
ncbi:bifunctional helix-turn-helix domain-containing protein/methylated-DNA--[protein]-cysteine S-methyltransferase [Tritonibacter horizontis]|uniref:methylated-DNA--[protein]-cysteine S-methyltransferase n=1 Tax=Tritonibacter horizontis TaxID=1768241 RepID=A0A132BZF3_9RHOB|nr:bifunctional helix-turn-helix domain-containing protein/methylated-DNA--[protein]-cysteine S-methyltransferase [Tritonibacter horizontis]KUP93741.1 bifunctional transcriptional activator/DNA repair enzyme Ada [Tritonibacter horizontis]